MRPRVFPAEDEEMLAERARTEIAGASMRPRVFPAEDANPSGSPATLIRLQ